MTTKKRGKQAGKRRSTPRRAGSGRASNTEARRKDTVESAIRLMQDKGFASMPLKLVADALEFSKANVYYHIKSKEQLLYHIFAENLEYTVRALEEIVAMDVDPAEKFRRIMAFYVRTTRGQQAGAPPAPNPNAAVVPGAGGGFGGLFGAQGMGSGLIRDDSVLSPSGLPDGPPAVLQAPKFGPGVKRQAMFFTDTNKGVIRNVGAYDRTQQFSIDFWFYPGQRYEFKPDDVYQSVPVLNHKNGGAGGNVGYRLQLEDGYLWLNLAHSTPAYMIVLKTRERLPVKEWTHITVTYDGSSRAVGARIYLNGRLADVDVDHDTLEGSGTMLPKSYMGGDFLGVMFGTRFREKAPIDSGIDELRFFDKELTPVEVSYLQNPEAIAGMSAEVLKRQLTDFIVAADSRVVAARKALEEASEAENQIVTRIPQLLVMGETPKPRPAYRLDRGLYNQRREELPVQALNRIFPWNEQEPRNRLGLTNWLFDPKNPLTARVFVNRIWQMHFGQGIVQTAEDFGTQGAIPTHPELLDWLAVTFVDSGWNVKQLQKMIVMSATYRQSSDVSNELLQRDATNLLLARRSRPRMSAEVLRDTALAVSGLLVQKVGGASVFPYQPSDIWNGLNTNYRYPAPETLPAEEQHRRSLYTFIKRNAEHPAMQIFDFTDRSLSKARRQTSNTPLQALELLNDPQFAEAYRVLATRVVQAGGPVDAQIERLFKLATRRRPLANETSVLRGYYDTQRSEFNADRERAKQLLAIGVTPVDANIDLVTLASMTRVAALVMNTPDAYTVR